MQVEGVCFQVDGSFSGVDGFFLRVDGFWPGRRVGVGGVGGGWVPESGWS